VAGWEQVLAEVIRTRRAALVGYASLYTVNRVDAERVLQEAVVRSFAGRRRLGTVQDAEAAIRRHIRVTCAEAARRPLQRPTLTVLDEVRTQGAVPVVDTRAALSSLSPRQRLCVVAVLFDELPVADAAADLGMSEGAVRRHLADGTAALRRYLGESVAWPTGGTTVTTISVAEGLVS